MPLAAAAEQNSADERRRADRRQGDRRVDRRRADDVDSSRSLAATSSTLGAPSSTA